MVYPKDVKCLLCGKNLYGSKNYPRYKLVKTNSAFDIKHSGDICIECGNKLKGE